MGAERRRRGGIRRIVLWTAVAGGPPPGGGGDPPPPPGDEAGQGRLPLLDPNPDLVGPRPLGGGPRRAGVLRPGRGGPDHRAGRAPRRPATGAEPLRPAAPSAGRDRTPAPRPR